MSRHLVAVVVALVLAGCLPPGAELDEPSAEPLPRLAEPAQRLPDEPAAAIDDGGGGETAPPANTGVEGTEQDDAVAAEGEPPPASAGDHAGAEPPAEPGAEEVWPPEPGEPAEAFVVLVDVVDAAGDAGIEAPDYADVVRLLVESSADTLRVTVEMAGDIPVVLDQGEVSGVGFDLFRGDRESDFQLFADGGSDGWRAFLQTPEGFVAYPGTFGIGGRRLVFTVPWAAVGGREPTEVSLFSDWSRQRVPLNATAADRVPNRGTITIRP